MGCEIISSATPGVGAGECAFAPKKSDEPLKADGYPSAEKRGGLVCLLRAPLPSTTPGKACESVSRYGCPWRVEREEQQRKKTGTTRNNGR